MTAITFNMTAPAAGVSYVAQSGNSYLSDVNKIITGVVQGDLGDLLADGCVELGSRAPLTIIAATVALTANLHANRPLNFNKADGIAATLPAAAGTGDKYTIAIGTTITSVGTTVKVANASDAFQGNAWVISDDSAAVLGYIAASGTDDTVTLNGTTKGGYSGHLLTFTDVAANVWQVESFGKATGTEATPFSATVS